MFKEVIVPRFYETDAYGHINNTVINQWFETARRPIFDMFSAGPDIKDWRIILARTEVDFVGQTYYGKEVEVQSFIERVGNKSFVVGQEMYQEGKLVARGKAVQVHFNQHTQESLPLTDEQRAQLTKWIKPNDQ